MDLHIFLSSSSIGIIYIRFKTLDHDFSKYKFSYCETFEHSPSIFTYSLGFNIEDKRRINEWNVKIFASLFYGL